MIHFQFQFLIILLLISINFSLQQQIVKPNKKNNNLRNLFGNNQWQQCVGTQVLQCVSCIFECGVEVAEVILGVADDLEQPEMIITEIPDILDMIKDCSDCISACSISVQVFNSECPSADNHCETDFCYSCCQRGASVCVGNDWTPVCTLPKRECICSSNSGNPDSCCSANGPGNGQNTGNFCGNDFHSNACTFDAPYCCTNDLNESMCCKEDGVCGGGGVGNQYCTSAIDIA